ncbi:MAG: hypothetical protein KA436_00365 [Oligoflexales bacterium]|nr:hypothetical protein [Oligoflexales bacterium]
MTLLEKICTALKSHSVSYAVVGGYAVALHGALRGTIDIDFIIKHEEEAFIATELALKSIGLQPRLPVTASEVFHFRKEYLEKRNLIAWSFYNPKNPIEIVDVIMTENLENCSVIEKKISSSKIFVLSKIDLIKMKRKSGRPQDLMDLEALEKI